MEDKLMYITSYIKQNYYFCVTVTIVLSTNQDLIKVPKVFKPSSKKKLLRYYNSLQSEVPSLSVKMNTLSKLMHQLFAPLFVIFHCHYRLVTNLVLGKLLEYELLWAECASYTRISFFESNTKCLLLFGYFCF